MIKLINFSYINPMIKGMTKNHKFLALIFFVCLIPLAIGCSSKNSPEKVAEKIQNNETLTVEDYDIMMDYLTEKVSVFIQLAQDGDEIGGINNALELEKDQIFPLFEEKVKGYTEVLTTCLMLGLGTDAINRSDYYPESLKNNIPGFSDVEEVAVDTTTVEEVVAYIDEGASGVAEESYDYISDISEDPASYDFSYEGKIGSYPIKLYYLADMDTADGVEVLGFYSYTDNNTVLKLVGEKKNNGDITFNEYTKTGNNSGEFNLKSISPDELKGVFKNKKNGNEFQVYLKAIK